MSDGYSVPPPPSQHSTAATVPKQADNSPGHLGGLQLAAWPRRSLATLIDVAVTLWLPTLLPKIGIAIAVILILANSVYMQSRTTQSLGKRIVGVHLVWPVIDKSNDMMAAYPSAVRCLIRLPAHLLDTIFFIGLLRPIWNDRRQTFADSIAKTVVMVDELNWWRAPAMSRSAL